MVVTSKSPKNSTKEPKTLIEKKVEKNQAKTRLIIKYDVGFSNELYIRGKGANLSWDKGQRLRNIKHDEWIWETDIPFTTCEFKVLINDCDYESGENHQLTSGTSVLYTPEFQ